MGSIKEMDAEAGINVIVIKMFVVALSGEFVGVEEILILITKVMHDLKQTRLLALA